MVNQCPNPSFEVDLSDWYWSSFTTQVALSTVWAADGTQSAKVTAGEYAGYPSMASPELLQSPDSACVPNDYVSGRFAVMAITDCQVQIVLNQFAEGSYLSESGGALVPLVADEGTVLEMIDAQITEPTAQHFTFAVKFYSATGGEQTVATEIAYVDACRYLNHGQVASGLSSLPFESSGGGGSGVPSSGIPLRLLPQTITIIESGGQETDYPARISGESGTTYQTGGTTYTVKDEIYLPSYANVPSGSKVRLPDGEERPIISAEQIYGQTRPVYVRVKTS